MNDGVEEEVEIGRLVESNFTVEYLRVEYLKEPLMLNRPNLFTIHRITLKSSTTMMATIPSSSK